jgi:phospholipase C
MHLQFLRKLSVGLLVSSLLLPTGLIAADKPGTNDHQVLVKKYYVSSDREPRISEEAKIELLRKKVKYLFVIYQENRSFDSYFGTFPGAEGIFSHPASQTPGFYQTLVNTDGTTGTIHPFRIGPFDQCPKSKVNGAASTKCYAADTDDIDHSHPRIVAKMDIQNNVPLMDKFSITEELKYSPTGNPSLKAKQFGELAMAYEDCDTIPLLWGYADKFVLFDNIFQTVTGPSTPGNLAIIAAQNGQTQLALHPSQGYTDNGSSAPGVPVLNDDKPYWGSAMDPNKQIPINSGQTPSTTPEINQTYATLPLTMTGGKLKDVVKSDIMPSTDLSDVDDDVEFISGLKQATIPFGWYQEGYDKEPTDPGPVDANGTHAAYITHHNGPAYFGYIANNPQLKQQLHGLGDFFSAIETRTLPKQGGVFFVKGGYQNEFNLTPVNPDATVQKNFPGDDDHPAYSDAQISEAMVAEAINKIAASPYWSQSAIIITWDDSEGDYDHVPPPLRTFGPAPDKSLVSDGPRVPFILISPYAHTHYVSHAQGSQSSVVKFVDTLFNLPPLALLPDELKGRELGKTEFGQDNLGPEDAISSGITDLVDAFSPARLMGRKAPLPPDYAKVSDALINTLPEAWGFSGCQYLGITTTDRQQGVTNTVPSDFNPRPSTNAN